METAAEAVETTTEMVVMVSEEIAVTVPREAVAVI